MSGGVEASGSVATDQPVGFAPYRARPSRPQAMGEVRAAEVERRLSRASATLEVTLTNWPRRHSRDRGAGDSATWAAMVSHLAPRSPRGGVLPGGGREVVHPQLVDDLSAIDPSNVGVRVSFVDVEGRWRSTHTLSGAKMRHT